MTKCQCLKADGKQCTRDGSTKSGHNPFYCWQHQSCKSAGAGVVMAPPRPAPKKPSEEKKSSLPPYVTEKALALMGTKSGKIYVIVSGGMGGMYVIKRDDIGGKLSNHWSHDEQYTDYKQSKKFIEGYRPTDKSFASIFT